IGRAVLSDVLSQSTRDEASGPRHWAFRLQPASLSGVRTMHVRAVARDIEGHSATIGTRRVTVRPRSIVRSLLTGSFCALVLGVTCFALFHFVLAPVSRRTNVASDSTVPVSHPPTEAIEWLTIVLILGAFVATELPWMRAGLEYDEMYTAMHFVVRQ